MSTHDITVARVTRADLVKLRDGHLATLDDILTNDIFLTTATARLLVAAIRILDAAIANIDKAVGAAGG